MNEREKIIQQSTQLKIVNQILDYSESLVNLSSEALANNKDKYTAKEYLYASMVLKTIAEEVLDTDYEKVLFPYDGRLTC